MLGGKGKTATKNRFALLIPMWMGVLANACGNMTYWGAYAIGGQTTRDSTESVVFDNKVSFAMYAVEVGGVMKTSNF